MKNGRRLLLGGAGRFSFNADLAGLPSFCLTGASTAQTAGPESR